jgi:hypothetical protein
MVEKITPCSKFCDYVLGTNYLELINERVDSTNNRILDLRNEQYHNIIYEMGVNVEEEVINNLSLNSDLSTMVLHFNFVYNERQYNGKYSGSFCSSIIVDHDRCYKLQVAKAFKFFFPLMKNRPDDSQKIKKKINALSDYIIDIEVRAEDDIIHSYAHLATDNGIQYKICQMESERNGKVTKYFQLFSNFSSIKSKKSEIEVYMKSYFYLSNKVSIIKSEKEMKEEKEENVEGNMRFKVEEEFRYSDFENDDSEESF